MPVYQYQGQHYELSETDPGQALAKIKSHLGQAEQPKEPESDFMKAIKEFGGDALAALKALPQFGGNVNSILDKSEGLKGPVEAIAHAGTSLPGFLASLPLSIPAAIRDPSQSIPEHASRISSNLTYEPKTQLGEDLSKPFDELMYRAQGMVGHGVPDLPQGTHTMPAPKVADTMPPMRNQSLNVVKPKGLDLNQFATEQQGAEPQPVTPPATPFSGLGARGPVDPYAVDRNGPVPTNGGAARLSNDGLQSPIRSPEVNMPPEEPNSFGNMADTLQGMQQRASKEADYNAIWQNSDLQKSIQDRSALAEQERQAAGAAQDQRVADAGHGVFDEMQGQLRQGEQSPYTPMGRPPIESTAMDLTARPAQQVLDARQAELEQGVAQRQSLDFNAAERARQEQAPVPGLDASKTFEQAMAEQRAMKEEQARQAEKAQAAKLAEEQRKAEEAQSHMAQGEAQRALERRQAELEFQVKKQQTADFNAAERARQQQAVVSGMDNAHVSEFREYAAKLDEAKKKAESDPNVLASDKRLQAAQELYTRVADGMQNGLQKPNFAILHRLDIDLQHFEEVAKQAREDAVKEAMNPLVEKPQPSNVGMNKPDLGEAPRVGKRSSIGGKQSGYILMDANKREAAKNLMDKLGIEGKLGEISASMWTPQQAIDAALKAKDVVQNVAQKVLNNFTKGGIYQALKTHNPMIRYVVEKIQEADRLSRAQVRDWVHGKMAPAMRALSAKEQGAVWTAIEIADLAQKPVDYVALAKAGATEAQIHLAKTLREALDHAYQQINKARAAAGKDPIDKRVAYAAMRASGDFRRLVYDNSGVDKKVIGVIGSDFRSRVNGLKGEMEKHGYFVGEERYYGAQARERNSSNQAFMSAIEHLADSDPRVAEFVDVLDKIRTSEVYSYLNTKKHTMEKKGVFGMEGRKSWMSPEQNAADGFKSQLNYVEAAIKWGNLSEASEAIKPVLNHPDIKMPVAKQWSERYLKTALGFNPSAVGTHLETALSEAFKSTGVGYSNYRKGVAVARQLTNGLLLMLNPRFWLTNVVQPMQAMPGMKAMMITRGLDAGFDFGTGASYLAQAANTIMKKKMGGLEGFEKEAAAYAQSHHVYGSDMIEHSNQIRKGPAYIAEQVSNFAAGNIESYTRQLAFYSFVHMLKENGMSEANGLHVAAHNLTDMMMNNYSHIDRPNVFNALGPVGDLAVNLQSYKFNELSRISLFARHAQEYGSLRPLMAHLGAGVAFGGILGTIGYDNADRAYHMITKLMGAPDSLTNRVLHMSEGLGKHIYDATGGAVDQPYLASHGLFSMAGMDMTKSLGITDVTGGSIADTMAPGFSKLGEIAKGGYDMATNPSEMNAKRLGRAAMPIGLQGAYDMKNFTNPNGLAVRPKDLKGQAYRTDTDKVLKYAGFSGVHEAVQKQKTYNIERQATDYNDIRDGVLNTLRDQMYTGTIKGDTVQQYMNAYGSPKTLETDLKKYAEQQHMTSEEFNLMHAAMSKSMAQRMKAQEYVRMFNDNK